VAEPIRKVDKPRLPPADDRFKRGHVALDNPCDVRSILAFVHPRALAD